MKVVIQRVKCADVVVDNQIYGSIQEGLLVFVGIVASDNDEDINWLAGKILNLRIFNDENEVMNRSLIDVDGELLVISQFTLHAKTKKGNRPSYIDAAVPSISMPLYQQFITTLQLGMSKPVQTGVFGADMKVSLQNDGPVTIIIDSRNKE